MLCFWDESTGSFLGAHRIQYLLKPQNTRRFFTMYISCPASPNSLPLVAIEQPK